MSNILIMSCSSMKLKNTELLPAYIRYDGPSYKILRKSSVIPITYIISAKYGLIGYNELIDDYEWKMDKQRAIDLNYEIVNELRSRIDESTEEIFLMLGSTYLKSVSPIRTWSKSANVIIPEGGIGMKLSALKKWLAK